MLLHFFAFRNEWLPLFGAYTSGTIPSWSLGFILDVIRHAILPAGAIVLAGMGQWALGMRGMAFCFGGAALFGQICTACSEFSMARRDPVLGRLRLIERAQCRAFMVGRRDERALTCDQCEVKRGKLSLRVGLCAFGLCDRSP